MFNSLTNLPIHSSYFSLICFDFYSIKNQMQTTIQSNKFPQMSNRISRENVTPLLGQRSWSYCYQRHFFCCVWGLLLFKRLPLLTIPFSSESPLLLSSKLSLPTFPILKVLASELMRISTAKRMLVKTVSLFHIVSSHQPRLTCPHLCHSVDSHLFPAMFPDKN